MADEAPLLAVEGLVKRFSVAAGGGGRATVRAVEDVGFTIGRGETLGLVGESGCGKSTVGRLILRLIEPSAGTIRLDGQDITGLGRRAMRPLRRRMQMVFQDPFGSLDPRQRAGEIVAEPLLVHGIARGAELAARVEELFRRVGLRTDQLRNFPAQFSGGQRQRLAIARALALGPDLIVADEPVSSLDVSIRAQVINLMAQLQAERGLSYLFVAHDLAVVRHISHRVAVMYLGRIVELAPVALLFETPRHPYTRALLAAVPEPDPRRRQQARALPQGEVPSPIDPPRGCAFHPRCPLATATCRDEVPLLRANAAQQAVACHHAE